MLFVTLVCHCPSESHKADCKMQNKKNLYYDRMLKNSNTCIFIYLFIFKYTHRKVPKSADRI